MDSHQRRVTTRQNLRTAGIKIGSVITLSTGKPATVVSARLNQMTVRRGDNRRVTMSVGV